MENQILYIANLSKKLFATNMLNSTCTAQISVKCLSENQKTSVISHVVPLLHLNICVSRKGSFCKIKCTALKKTKQQQQKTSELRKIRITEICLQSPSKFRDAQTHKIAHISPFFSFFKKNWQTCIGGHLSRDSLHRQQMADNLFLSKLQAVFAVTSFNCCSETDCQ